MAYSDPFALSLARRTIRAGQQTAPESPDSVLTPEDESRIGSSLLNRTGQFVETVGTVLDTPGAIVRGALAGKPLSGFSTSPESRVSGEDLLSAYGILPDNTYGLGTLAGFATEVLTDPLTHLTTPLRSLGVGGAAVSKAGLLQYAPHVAQLKAGAAGTKTGAFTTKAISRLGLDPTAMLNNATLQARPLIGQRLANATTTVDEVVRAAPDYNQALKNVQDALGDVPYDSVKNQRIGGGFGWQSITGNTRGLFNQQEGVLSSLDNLTGSQKFADTLDLLGQKTAWSGPSRVISSFVNQRSGGDADELSQMLALRASDQKDASVAAMRRLFTGHANQLYGLQIPAAVAAKTGISNFFESPAANDSILRILENHLKPVDQELLNGVPGLAKWVDSWHTIAEDQLRTAKQLGLTSAKLTDPKGFGTRFTPVEASELDILRSGTGNKAEYSTGIRNQMARNEALKTPEGRFQLRELSRDPRIREYMKLSDADVIAGRGETDKDIGEYIIQQLNDPRMTAPEGVEIARTMRRLKAGIADDRAVFDTHPIISQGHYLLGEATRTANARSVMEAIGDSAVYGDYRNAPGGKHISVSAALKKIGDAVGLAKNKKGLPNGYAANQVRQAILNAAGGTGNLTDIRLKDHRIPESIVNRLIKNTQFLTDSSEQKTVSNAFDQYTTLFKGFILAWPSTKVRDSYSNLFSSYLETGDISGSLQGFWAASKILNNEWDSAMPYLRTVPRYRNVINDPTALKNQVIEDVGGTGILTGLVSSDLLSSSSRGDIGQYVPGSSPISVTSGLKKLIPTGQNSGRQMLKDFATIKDVSWGTGTPGQSTKNPILMAAQEVGDSVDSIGRLGTFLALSKQAVAAEEAASRVSKALVNYGNLTNWERTWARRIFPWWAYQSRMGKYVAEQVIGNPGGTLGKTIRFSHDVQQSDDASYVPSALREQFAVRLPFLSSEGPAGKTNTFLSDVDLPGFDIFNNISPQAGETVLEAASNTFGATMRKVGANMHPLAGALQQRLTGIDSYSGEKLENANTPLRRLAKTLNLPYDANVNLLLNLLPALQRPLQVAGALADDRIPMSQRVLKAGVNNLTGVKIKTIDANASARDAIAKLEAESAPYSRELTIQTISKDELAKLSPEKQKKWAYLQKLRKERAAASKLKKKAADKAKTSPS